MMMAIDHRIMVIRYQGVDGSITIMLKGDSFSWVGTNDGSSVVDIQPKSNNSRTGRQIDTSRVAGEFSGRREREVVHWSVNSTRYTRMSMC